MNFCYYLPNIVALLGPLEGLPYFANSTYEAEGVITNFTYPYDYYYPLDVVDETSCDDFGGNAVITCVLDCT